jgi:CHAT domain-containing protein/tetratricopeptide (TPR) repeat protein
MAELEEAIRAARQAVKATPENDSNRITYTNNLGNLLAVRYERIGAGADLDEAIGLAQEAVDITPADCTNWAAYLYTLAIRLDDRYKRIGATSDLEEGIRVARQAVDATTKSHLQRALCTLGDLLGERYLREGTIADLNKAIELAQQAVDITPEDDSIYAGCLDSLGYWFGHRYLNTEVIRDLDEAIRLTRQAVHTTSEDDIRRTSYLSNLDNWLSEKYEATHAAQDLEEAIVLAQEVDKAIPEDQHDRAVYYNTIGDRLGSRYRETRSMSDLNQIIFYYRSALEHTNSSVINRIIAGRQLLSYHAMNQDWQAAYEAAVTTISLIPKLTSKSLPNSDKQHRLSQFVGLASVAAAVALQADKDPLVALELLEEGRGVLAASIEEMRVDVIDLQEQHSGLARRFDNLRTKLDQPQKSTPVTETGQSSGGSKPYNKRHDASQEFEQLISKIRDQPGFERFLLSPGEKQMREAARIGPIVVINLSHYRCDAIIVEEQGVRSLRLNDLNHMEVEEMAIKNGLTSMTTLQWLWKAVMEPILQELGFGGPPTEDEWPHVWWIPTGPLSKFPLHAAGLHETGSTDMVLDRVMSSYSSSIKAIIQGRSRQHGLVEAAPSISSNQALFVAMEEKPEHHRLEFATDDVKMLRDLCDSMDLKPIEPGRQKQEIVFHLPNCKVFHFAGHGYSDINDPAQSHLALSDWKSDPLTVANLLEMNLRQHGPFLAYLSACGTGQMKNGQFSDESIHLISACQLAGFRHVIGTLWEVDDMACVEMSRITYEEMSKSKMTDESVCRGLHKASRELRRRWLLQQSQATSARGSVERLICVDGNVTLSTGASEKQAKESQSTRDAALFGRKEKRAPLHWVPYVHFGV